MIETGLVYIRKATPDKTFVGCGALLEGDVIATCKHVWRDAKTNAQPENSISEVVEIHFPYFPTKDGDQRITATLADLCDTVEGWPPDLVLLRPTQVPPNAFRYQLAYSERHEIGNGFAYAGTPRRGTTQDANPATCPCHPPQ